MENTNNINESNLQIPMESDAQPQVVPVIEPSVVQTTPVIEPSPILAQTNVTEQVEQPTPTTPVEENHAGMSFIDQQIGTPIDKINEDEEIVSLPSKLTKDIVDALRGLPDMSDKKNVEFANWGAAIRDSLEYVNPNNIGLGSLLRADSAFKQHMTYEGNKIGARESRMADRTGSNIKDEVAKSRLGNYLRLSTKFQAQMYHSGFWITFKSPTELELIQLITDISNIKVSYGRDMRGMIYSSSMVAIVDRVVNFAIDHIYSTTIKNFDGDYRDIIDYRDLDLMLWGIAVTMYPRGFQYRRACLNDPEKCNYIAEERLNLQALIRTDDNIPDHAKRHMVSRMANEKELSSVKAYSDALRIPRSFELTASNGNVVRITLKPPTLKEYITDGYKWINFITGSVESAIEENENKEEREAVVQSAAKATMLRTYGHFIQSVELVAEDNIIDDRDSIEDALDMLSSDNSIREPLIREITDYIDSTMHAMIAIPSYDCPKCGQPQQVFSEGRWVEDIPLEVLSLFFSLLFQKVSRISNRDM